MRTLDSKALFMMNGGNKLYIWKDGFSDVYEASPEEEAQWVKELIRNALNSIDTETNFTALKQAIHHLCYHCYPGVEALLLSKLEDDDPKRRITFANALWCISGYEQSFGIIQRALAYHREECFAEVFWALNDFKDNQAVRIFLTGCLEGTDRQLNTAARGVIGLWAFTGMPQLRENGLYEILQSENDKDFHKVIRSLKKIFNIQ